MPMNPVIKYRYLTQKTEYQEAAGDRIISQSTEDYVYKDLEGSRPSLPTSSLLRIK